MMMRLVVLQSGMTLQFLMWSRARTCLELISVPGYLRSMNLIPGRVSDTVMVLRKMWDRSSVLTVFCVVITS